MFTWYRLTSSFFKAFFYCFYRYRVYGNKNPIPGAAIIAPNHTSFLDPPLISAAWPEDAHFLARSSLFQSRFGAWLFPRLNSHPVQNDEQNLDTFRTICNLLKQNKKVVVFPEGSRSVTGELQALKSGVAMLALRMNCPIIPVYIDGTYEAWPRHQRFPTLNARVACVFGNPIMPTNTHHANKKLAQEALSFEVQQKIEALRHWYEAGAVGPIP